MGDVGDYWRDAKEYRRKLASRFVCIECARDLPRAEASPLKSPDPYNKLLCYDCAEEAQEKRR